MRKSSIPRDGHPAGVALVVALLMMLIVTMLGTGLTIASRSATQVGTSFTNQQLAFQAAEAGLEHAREWLRQQRYNAQGAQPDFSVLLAARDTDGDGQLILSDDLSNFADTNGFSKAGSVDDTPVRAPTTLFGTSYQVFLTNDPVDGIQSVADTNNTITLTSFGSGPNGVGFAALQAVYETIFSKVDAPLGPSPVTLLGPSVDFNGPSSQNFELDGDAGTDPNTGTPICYPSIATTSNDSRDTIRTEISALTTAKQANFHTCNPAGGSDLTGPPTVINYIDNNADPSVNPYQPTIARGSEHPLAGQVTATPPELTTSYWTNLIASLTTHADYKATTDPGFTLGRENNPKVVVLNGDFALQQSDCPHNNPCAGVLVVQGDFTVNGTPSYTGAIYAVGTGNVVRNGTGKSIWCGGLIVADIINDNDDSQDSWLASGLVGQPTYTHNGGGTSSQGLCDLAGNGFVGEFGTSLRRISFQQLRDQ